MSIGFENIKQLDSEYILHTYNRKNVCFVEGKGMELIDTHGNKYIDYLSCIGSMSFGYSHPEIVEIICKQASKLTNSSNLFYDKNKSLLAQNIVQKLGGGFKLFFSNSGAESNEGAIKLARLYGRKNLDGAYGIITAKKSFHGRTVATLSATGQDSKQDPFRPLLDGFTHVEINDKNELKQAVEDGFDGTKACALMFEPVLGEGGVWPLDIDYLQYARKLCDEHNLIFIFDEVQTGFGRCGKNFAYELYDVVPDIITFAKGMGAGMSIGAFAANDKLSQYLEPGMHGSTFGGNALCSAVSLKAMQLMDDPSFLLHVNEVGKYFREQLEQLSFIDNVRGYGLMIGATILDPQSNKHLEIAPKFVEIALEHGFVLNNTTTKDLRFLPPLICDKTHVDILINEMPIIFKEVYNV